MSLLECLIFGPGSYGLQDNISHYYNIFPHYVITGNQHISDTDAKISNVYLLLDDATTLFHDNDAFGVVPDPHSIVKKIIESQNINHKISEGDYPWVGYYTGKREIFSSDTAIGRISAAHFPRIAGGPGGVKIDNKIFVNLRFGEAITFDLPPVVGPPISCSRVERSGIAGSLPGLAAGSLTGRTLLYSRRHPSINTFASCKV